MDFCFERFNKIRCIVSKEGWITMSSINNRRLNYTTRGYGPTSRFLFVWWRSVLRLGCQLERKFSIRKFTLTLLAFALFLFVLPLFIFFFTVLGCYRRAMKLWLSWRENWEVEIADVTFRTAMETSQQEAILTSVLTLEGIIEVEDIKDWLKDFLERKDTTGKRVHRNFQRQLQRVNGFFAWKNDPGFCLESHVTSLPSHHRGRTLTERNIQEYVSEICSKPLPSEESPWQVKITTGVSEIGDPITWVIFQFHHLLANQLCLPNFPSSLPNPWDSISSTHSFALLEAPSATKKFLVLIKNVFLQCLNKIFLLTFVSNTVHKFTLFSQSCNMKYLKRVKTNNIFDYWRSMKLFMNQSFVPLKNILFNKITFQYILKYFLRINSNYLKKIIFYSISCIQYMPNYLKYIGFSFRSFVFEIMSGKNDFVNLCKDASREIYWVIRAMISLPRLLMEEILATKSTVPLHIWRKKGTKMWNRTMVSWSEEVPLGGAMGIQGATGASLSSVLVTALSGSIRDLIRCSGIQTPDYLRCTLPVYVPHTLPNQGLVPFPLPTGSSYGKKALKEVCRYLERMRKYPESYLASVWMVKHISKFIPEIILKRILKFLTASHPVLLMNLVGPSSTTFLWGLPLKSMFYWRPPQHNAVISVCIFSYCGRVSLGVLADGWAVPNAHTLPQSFASHLNELAVESGVKLERQNSKLWSRTSSPRSTPSPTPPPTPTINGWTPFSSDALKNRLQGRLNHSFNAKDKRRNREKYLSECLEEYEQTQKELN